MSLLSQSTYTLKRVAKESYSASLTPETIALPANSVGEVQDYANAKAKVRLTYDGKEIFPVYDERLDSEIGRRNLLLNSRFTTVPTKGVNGTVTVANNEVTVVKVGTAHYGFALKFSNLLVQGEKYILSFELKTSDVASLSFVSLRTNVTDTNYGTPSGGNYAIPGIDINGEYKKYTLVMSSTTAISNGIVVGSTGNGQSFSVRNIKFETGEKATDWTPAPEDVVSTMITQNCTASIDANGEVSVTNLTADAGYVDIPISYGQFSTVKRLTLAKSKQGRSIVSSTHEYAQSTSATTAPETGWVTTPPTWVDGRYIWMRIKITYSEGDPATTDPVNLTGAGGSVGKGIDSITTEFYLSTSKTTQTGGSWSETRPAWVTGKYLWTRLKIVYKNPTSTAYTTPIVSSEWEAVNNLRTELVLDYTAKLDVLEDQIEANVTETASVKNSVTGLTTRVSQAEASLTIQSGQISSKVAKTDYDANNVAVNQQISLIQQQANQVEIKVGKMRTGAKNLLRNYDMSIPNMKYWSAGATLVTESGTPTQQLTVLSVVQPSSITVAQGGAVYPPSTIVLNISDGSTRTIGVSWGSYSSSAVGTYTIPGSYNLPSGITGNKPAVSFTLIVGTAALTAVSVAQPNGVSVPQGGTPELPTTVTLNISDGTVRTVAVTWSSYSTTTSGTFTLTGTYNLPSGVTGNKPPVSLSLTVASMITITSVVAPNNATITAGGTYTPPATITLNLSTGTNQTVPVTWSFYDINVPGVYTLNGSYNLPEGVTGSKPSVSYTLTVSEQPVSLTITSVVQPSGVSVEQGGTITLPTTVTLNISDGSTRTVSVTWGEYSTGSAGNYTINGSYNLPSGVTGDKPAVSVALTVVAPTTIVSCINWPFNQTVNQGDAVNLGIDYPTLTFTLSDGSTVTLPVTWSSVDTSTVGDKTSTASYTNPVGVTGNFVVSVSITVLEVQHMDFMSALVAVGGTSGSDGNGSYVLFNGTTPKYLDSYIKSWLASATDEYSIFIKAMTTSGESYMYGKLSNNVALPTIEISNSMTYVTQVVKTSGAYLSTFFIQPANRILKIYGLQIRKTDNPPSWYI